jgi:catechol 2,3-dioxygenase-like lactoylglutathione lyase family enzyme
MTLLVHDLDATKDFYMKAFGFNCLYDGEVAPGLRTVHVGPGGQAEPGLWLLKATSPEGTTRIGAQTAGEPALVFYTESLADDLRHLETLGVSPLRPVAGSLSGTKFAHVVDNNGNEIVLVELHENDITDDAYLLTDTPIPAGTT